MRVELFDFHLPPERIAHQPVEPKDTARLLHVSTQLGDYIVRDLPALLRPGDMLVFNNSRVIPARLFCDVSGKRLEILLHKPCADGSWIAFAKPAKKLKQGMVLHFAEDFSASVEGRSEDGQVYLRFAEGSEALYAKLETHGHVPLPPYISRADTAEDKTLYQTIYAQPKGSVAAPTAGLHFTPELFAALEARGVRKAFVTLHVGAGTFQPVKVNDTAEHQMHSEWAEITPETASQINAARAAGGRVVAVGTTSMRTLETAATTEGIVQPFTGDTDIFITPGYQFKIVEALLTNFHLPKSTLFMLVSAFSGLERMQHAYAHAIASEYRFYSYGDACLLEPA
jgi:S-adenosylmethionine:tRNA ribosyltransferase-isomerase